MNNSNARDVYVVMDGTKIAGIYQWREDAKSHATACAGSVVVQQLRFETPGWVKVMNDSAKEKAHMQNMVKR